VVFSGFQYNRSGTAAPTAANIDVAPLSGATPGLRFSTDDGWGATSQAWIRYTVTVNPTVNTDIDRVLLDASVGMFLGSYTVGKYLCAGGGFQGTPSGGSALAGLSCSGGSAGSMSQSGSAILATAVISRSATLSPGLTTIGVLDYVNLGGLFSSLNFLENRYDPNPIPVPEPATDFLVGLSLLAFAGVLSRRRRRSRLR
jgi:hypothetical protein